MNLRKKIQSGLLCGFMIPALTLVPTFNSSYAAADTVVLEKGQKTKKPEVMYRVLLKELNSKYSVLGEKLPVAMVQEVKEERLKRLNTELKQKIADLENESNKDAGKALDEAKKEAKLAAVQELGRIKKEMTAQVLSMQIDELDKLAEVFSNNQSYTDFEMEYMSAFTRNEKAAIIVKALAVDLDRINTMLMKKTNRLSKASFVADLKKSLTYFNDTKLSGGNKSYGKTEIEEILLYAGIAIAAVGVVSWGVASIVYGGRYRKARSQREAQFNQLRSELQAQYNDLFTYLTNEELSYLNSNGFALTQCASYSQPDSIICNGKNYNVYSGEKFCTVKCYKNATTGQETLHQAPVCSSPFIPSDCYDPTEYELAYDDGYGDGYDDGYFDGELDGDEDGAFDGDDDGYEDGFDDGYADGYDDGFTAGYNTYWDGKSANKAGVLAPKSNKLKSTYEKGYRDGLRDAEILFGINAA